MSKKKVLAPQVKRLMTGVSDHGERHLVEIENDLQQIALLLSEAIEKLSTNFVAVNESVRAQQKSIDQMLVAYNGPQEHVQALQDLSREIDTSVNAVVTAMQFQDMTSQLIARIIKRVNGLRDFLGLLSSTGSEMQMEMDAHEIMVMLCNVNLALAIHSLELRSSLPKVVTQKHLESGDIDLF